MFILALTFLFSAHAEVPLTYEAALTRALEANPELQQAALSRDQSKASLLASRAIFDPSLNVSGNYSWDRNKSFFQGIPFEMKNRNTMGNMGIGGTTPTGTSYNLSTSYMRNYGEYEALINGSAFGEASVQDEFRSSLSGSITQQILRGHRYAFNMQSVLGAKEALNQSELRYQQTRQTVLSNTAQAYWSWVYQEELLSIRRAAVEVSSEALRIGRLKFEAKDLAEMEVTRLEAAWVQDQSSELDAQNATRQAQTTLLLGLGRSPTETVTPAPMNVDIPELTLSLEAATKVALTQNIELALSRASVEQADLSYRLAKHALLPTLTATFSAGLGSQGTDAGSALSGVFQPGNFPNMSVNGQFSMPLGNRAARGERYRNESILASQRLALKGLEQSILAQVSQQVHVLNSARKRVELADVNRRLAEQTLTAEEAIAEVGRALQKDVLEARNALESARVEAVKTRTDYQLAWVELRRLQGILDTP